MRLLCIDHFFAQDIEGLRADRADNSCWSVPYEPFLVAAREVFDGEVWTGIEAFFDEKHAAARGQYGVIASRMVDELYEHYRPDAVCAPSDTFFWIRAVIDRFRELGVPFVVLQKEATIPPGWLDGPAQEWGGISPFIADHMLVSSQNHAQFWINSGVDSSIVDVTGQPRFDLYARPELARPLSDLGIEVPSDRPVVLFLTYDESAYLPVIDRTGLAPWQQLRRETEQTLIALAADGKATVLIKGHPQPAEDQAQHLAVLGKEPGIQIVEPQADVRHVICAVDAVVGFQTTALLESLAARRPTIYTFWSAGADQYADDLIPFHVEGDALTIATSPDELRIAVESALKNNGERETPNPAAIDLVLKYIGPVDGKASQRCWSIMEGLAQAASAKSNSARRALDAKATARRRRHLAQAAGAAAAWTAARRAARIGYPVYRSLRTRVGNGQPLGERQFERELENRARLARERVEATSP